MYQSFCAMRGAYGAVNLRTNSASSSMCWCRAPPKPALKQRLRVPTSSVPPLTRRDGSSLFCPQYTLALRGGAFPCCVLLPRGLTTVSACATACAIAWCCGVARGSRARRRGFGGSDAVAVDVDRGDVVSLRRSSSLRVALLRSSVWLAERLALCALGLVAAARCAAWAVASGTCTRGDDGLYSSRVL